MVSKSLYSIIVLHHGCNVLARGFCRWIE